IPAAESVPRPNRDDYEGLRPQLDPFEEILPPTQVTLRTRPGSPSQGSAPVMATLTADAVWIQETYHLRKVPLQALATIESRPNASKLALTFTPEAEGETLVLGFPNAHFRDRWCQQLLAQQQQTAAAPQDRYVPEGVSLVQGSLKCPHVVVARVEASALTYRKADRTLQLRAGIRGADA